jgi:DNA polymerase
MTDDPVFIDLETRSVCDLRTAGGWNYATHPSTRFLTVAWSPAPDEYHVWLSGVDRLPPKQYLDLHLAGVTVHAGGHPPDELIELTGRPWAAHNAWTFDEPVWRALTRGRHDPVRWIDTYPLALSVGLPGGLNQIGQRLWGEGKYEQGSAALKKVSRQVHRPVGAGELCLVAKYNVQDVRLLGWLWAELNATLRTTDDERRVLAAHAVINSRGTRVDRGLLRELILLTEAARVEGVKRIAKLTGGFLSTQTDLNSRAKVFQWLDKMGVNIGTSLRRDVVQRYVDSVAVEDEEDGDEPVVADGDDLDERPEPDVPADKVRTVVDVLSLRSNVLRVTGGKLTAAAQAIGSDDRLRGLYVYHGAHTGRDAHRRVQVGNLPRPKDTVDPWGLIRLYETLGSLPIGAVQKNLTDTYEKKAAKDPNARPSTADDAAAALIRMMLVPSPGKVFAAADFAAIEARVLAWLAGEQWMIDAFNADADLYLLTAARIFGPHDSWPVKPHKKHPWRQVAKVVELGSGYQLGSKTLGVYALAQGVDLEAAGTTAPECITAYRSSHPKIAGEIAGEWNGLPYYRGGLWGHYNVAALRAVDQGKVVETNRVVFQMFRGHLYVTLPSGRNLVYRHAKVETVTTSFGKEVEAVRFVHPRYGWVTMYGGKWTENIDQAISRDLMAAAMVRMEDAGLWVVVRVHDELVAELPNEAAFPLFMECMTTLPDWAEGLPLDAEGGLAPRYAKSPPPGVKEEVWRNGRYHKAA